jgi:hypothetical protein
MSPNRGPAQQQPPPGLRLSKTGFLLAWKATRVAFLCKKEPVRTLYLRRKPTQENECFLPSRSKGKPPPGSRRHLDRIDALVIHGCPPWQSIRSCSAAQ